MGAIRSVAVSKADAVEEHGEAMARSLPMSFFATALPMQRSETGGHVPRLFENIGEAFEAVDGRLLLLGDPGAGKTTTLMAFAREAVARRLENAGAPLPLYGRIADWKAKETLSLCKWLSDSYHLDEEAVAAEFVKGSILLLLDGLDELGPMSIQDQKQAEGKRRDPRVLFMEALKASLAGYKALVTSRIADYETIGKKIALGGNSDNTLVEFDLLHQSS
jgi:predicted NACHT family NTPase